MKSRGRKPDSGRRDWLDDESRSLLTLYDARRLESSPPPTPGTLRTERALLRSLLLASKSLGGPGTLSRLIRDPETIVRILRGEWPIKHTSLLGMLAATLRLIDIAIDDPEEARSLRKRITGGLHPRPTTRRWAHFLPRTAGGSMRIRRSRPILTEAHLHSIVQAAASLSEQPGLRIRNEGLLALICWSGISTAEAPALTWERFEWQESRVGSPWCAWLHGISRRRRKVSVPVHVNAEPYLRALERQAVEANGRASGPLFVSSTRGGRLSFTQAARIYRATFDRAGLPGCDDTTLRRAYTAFLRMCGLNDYAIRDALAVKRMATVDGLVKPSRRSAAQSVAAEHHVVDPPVLDSAGLHGAQLPLVFDQGLTPDGTTVIRLLGVDPAYRRTGWAIITSDETGDPVVEANGVIVTEATSLASGLLHIEEQFQQVLEAWRPARALLEKPGRWMHKSGTSRHSVELMAMARGAMMKACGRVGIPVSEVDFQQVRLALLGRANAGKAEAADLLRSLGLMPAGSAAGRIDSDVIDAIMMALYGLRHS